MRHLIYAITLLSILTLVSCKKNKPGSGGGSAPSTNKAITSFVFKVTDNPGLAADIAGVVSSDSVVITVPYGTIITALKPVVVHTGVSVTPASGAAKNFSSPVTYTVTAEDGSTKNYLAVVKIHIKSTVYAGSTDGKLYAFDGDNGTVKWTYTTAGAIGESCPAYYNGTVYVGSADGYIHAVDAVTGVMKWKYGSGGINLGGSSIAVNNAGALYYGSYNGSGAEYLRALNANTGVMLWQKTHPNARQRPTWYNGVVYAGGLYGMDGFNASDGTPGIHFTSSIVAGNAVVVNNTIYNGTEGTIVSAYNATTGAAKWLYPGISVFGPTLYKGTVYNTGSQTSGALYYLYALDEATGTLKWKFTAGGISSDALCSPVAANDIVYTVHTNGRFYALDAATGTQRWMFEDNIGGSTTIPYFNCTVKGDIVYFGNQSKNFYALNALNGALIWKYTTGGVINGGACVVAEDGSLYYSGISGQQQ